MDLGVKFLKWIKNTKLLVQSFLEYTHTYTQRANTHEQCQTEEIRN